MLFLKTLFLSEFDEKELEIVSIKSLEVVTNIVQDPRSIYSTILFFNVNFGRGLERNKERMEIKTKKIFCKIYTLIKIKKTLLKDE